MGACDGIHIAAAVQYNDTYTDNIVSYVTPSRRAEGGMHEMAGSRTHQGDERASEKRPFKGKGREPLGARTSRRPVRAVLALKMQNAVRRADEVQARQPGRRGRRWRPWSPSSWPVPRGLRNARTVEKVLGKAVEAARVREAARRVHGANAPSSRRAADREVGQLFGAPGVGERAVHRRGRQRGGSAKQGRDHRSRFQGHPAASGQPLNAEKKRLDQVLANEEFRVIIAALGTGIDEDFNIDALKYGKIIILSDADQDGAHIRAILLTFFPVCGG